MNRTRFAVSWMTALCLVIGSSAMAAPARDAQPEIDIPYTKFVLDNGLRVIVHEDHKSPIVAVNVWYHVGSKNEQPGKTGLAHLFEHLMFNGSENYNDDSSKTMTPPAQEEGLASRAPEASEEE